MKFKKFQKVKTALLATVMSVMLFSTSAFATDNEGVEYDYGKTTTKEYDRIAEHQSALGNIQAPKDYTGVGYLLEKIYHVKPEIPTYNGIDQYTKLALGGLETSIEEGTDGHYYLNMKGYYEFNMDCWSVDGNWFKFSGMGKEKDPYSSVKGTEGKDYTSDFNNTTKPDEVNVGNLTDIYVYTKQNNTYSKNEDSNSGDLPFKLKDSKNVAVKVGDATKNTDLWKDEPAGGGNYKVSYFGSDGMIDFYYSVNGGTIKKGTIKVKNPNEKNPAGGYLLPSEAYSGEFEQKFDLGTSPVSNVRFKTIMGDNSCMYVLGDGTCYPDLVEEIALIEKQADSSFATYKVQLDANAAFSGDYNLPVYYTDASGDRKTINESVYLGKGKDTYTFDLIVPKEAYNFRLGGITSNTPYCDNFVRPIKSQFFNIDIKPIRTSSTSIESGDYYKGERNIEVAIDYNLSSSGVYEFWYSYVTVGTEVPTIEKKYVTNTYNFKSETGTEYTTVKIPVTDTSEVKLSRVKSPDGVEIYPNKVIYQNENFEQPTPQCLDASVEVIEAKKIKDVHVSISAIIKLAIPEDKKYTLVLETKKEDGSYKYVNMPLRSKTGYYKLEYGTPNTTYQPITLDKDTIYAKLYRIEEGEYNSPVLGFDNQYLYCEHIYSYDCDVDCDRCGAFREAKAHIYDSVCDSECNVCHEHRKDYEDHKFSYGCSVKCENAGCNYESSVIIHEVEDFCATKCKWCELSVEPVHYFNNSNTCEKCGFVRTVKTGWVADGDKWSFYSEDGIKQTGWKFIKNNWYYMDKNGIMQTGFKTIGGKVYYFDEAKKTEGIMVTGLKTINGKKYYFDNNGAMGVGWKKVADKWYFFDQNNQSAAVMNKWIKSGANWYYLGKDGTMVTNNWSPKDSAGKYYWLNADGIMVRNKWIIWKGNYYYLGDDGAMQTNKWIKDNGKYYWVGSEGNMLCSQWVDGGKYYVDSTGAYDSTKIK